MVCDMTVCVRVQVKEERERRAFQVQGGLRGADGTTVTQPFRLSEGRNRCDLKMLLKLHLLLVCTTIGA